MTRCMANEVERGRMDADDIGFKSSDERAGEPVGDDTVVSLVVITNDSPNVARHIAELRDIAKYCELGFGIKGDDIRVLAESSKAIGGWSFLSNGDVMVQLFVGQGSEWKEIAI